MENDKSTNSSNKLSLFKLLYYRWKTILAVALICIVLGTTFSILKNNVSYKASKSVMLVTEMVSKKDVELENAVTGDIINDIFEQIKSDKYVAMVNEEYQSEGVNISKSAISTSKNNEDTFIFTITYTASSPEKAVSNLEYIIEFSGLDKYEKPIAGKDPRPENFFEFHTAADTITLKEVQRDATVYENNPLAKNIILSVFLSLVLAVLVALIVGLFDNTIIDKNQLEEITGANLLAFIDDTDLPVKTKKHKKK